MRFTFIIGGALLACTFAPATAYALTECASCRESAGLPPGQVAADAALAMLGVPYAWGGGDVTGPTLGTGRGKRTKGFDCAGLTEYAWARAGLRIGSSTYTQWRSGSRIPRHHVQAGDLAFYETNAKRRGPDHVGLTINGEQMVVAPFTGTVVRIENIDRRGYAGIVRPAGADDRRGM
ncbi:C40 family peptidase [Nonomuraea typhae]|uniref:C40 family peptidase n=1 Tax=Nonomuraea typhae TaxID=2603600 RepID=A0ABW7YUD5_9ACTN